MSNDPTTPAVSAIVCTHCGSGSLSLNYTWQGRPYMQEQVVDSISCDDCYAEWDSKFQHVPGYVKPGVAALSTHPEPPAEVCDVTQCFNVAATCIVGEAGDLWLCADHARDPDGTT